MNLWTWNDMSNPKIPSRNIKWDFVLPFILSMSGSLFWPGHSFQIIFFSLFGFDYITNVFCGNRFESGFKKWFWYINFGRGWNATFYIGISKTAFITHSLRRLMRKRRQ